MSRENVSDSKAVEPAQAASAKAVDDQVIDEPVGPAQAEGLPLTGEGGLPQQLTKRLPESALEPDHRRGPGPPGRGLWRTRQRRTRSCGGGVRPFKSGQTESNKQTTRRNSRRKPQNS